MVRYRCSPPLLLLSTRATATEVLVVLTIYREIDTTTAAVGVILITDMIAAEVLVAEV